jgi:Tol biopolymer transport system component
MTLKARTRLGPYEIQSAIGAGGMGEVYRARDTRLDRTVAIKVLPSQFAADPQFRERFDREARAISSLNHPHICTLHDVGHQDGTAYLVMEYVESETLAARLTKGPLPLDQVLRYAIEIADALDKAHRAGITHRDLKPGNIMLSKSGSGSKLLDFGLAKLRQNVSPTTPISELPTAKDPVTAQGTILGTLQYMAPEQAEGGAVDARTDIFAFGVVVCEMATGKKAFEGKSQASLIAKILEHDPPPMSTLQPMTPPARDRVVKKCLAKEREDRWQSAKDLTDELKWIAGASAEASKAAVPEPKPAVKSWRRAAVLGLAIVALGTITGVAILSLRRAASPAPQPVSRFTITLPPGDRLGPGLGADVPAFALSPDGTRLAYVVLHESNASQLYLRAMDSLEVKPVPDTGGASAPFFSPDSQWVGFFAGTKLKKVSVSGGGPLTICDAGGTIHSASWGADDIIVFHRSNTGLFQVPSAGGTPKPLTTLDSAKGFVTHRWPEVLPGGKAVLFDAGKSTAGLTNAQVVVRSQSGELRDLIPGGMRPSYAPTGHLVYVQSGTLMAVPFDLQRLQVTGPPVPVLDGVLQLPSTGVAQYSFSSSGSLAYVAGGVRVAERRLVWVDRKGGEQPVPAPARAYRNPRLSPDGQRVAVAVEEQDTHTWLYDLSRGTLTRWTFEGGINRAPVWTPDGKRIVFQSSRAGPQNLFWQLADGGGGAERLTTSEYTNVASSWSPDGQVLAFTEVHPTTGFDIWVLRLSDHNTQPFLRTQFNEAAPRFSPDGHWLAYVSDESGRNEIYVQPYPGPGGKWQVSTDGGTEPVWNRNGRELFYRNGNKMVAVETTTQPSFSAGKPKLLFDSPYEPVPSTLPNFDVSPDGQRFLMLKPTQEAAATQINVVLNWFEELKQKVPTGKK